MEKETIQNGILISFGDVYEHRIGEDTSLYVIVDLSENNLFHASHIINKDGKEQIVLPGSHKREHIDKIIGKKTLEEIISGVNNHFSGKIPKEILDDLLINSKKPSKIFTSESLIK